MPHARRVLGDAGEHLAERELRARGWRVVARNARTRYGEIDLVCHDGRGFVFVEVKTRREGAFVSAVEATGPAKIAKVARLADAWLALHGHGAADRRLAIVAVTVGRRGSVARLLDVVD